MATESDALIAAALRPDKFAIARLITQFEDSRPQARTRRAEIIAQLEQQPDARRGVFIGITGTPGAGKSSLVGELAKRLITSDPDWRVAVVAVDPTSHVSGGSLLGDRTRVQFPVDEPRLFFRSQPSQLDLGGLGRTTFQVCRLLRHLFDVVFVETVGIGQSEIDIRYLADRTYLVLQPLGGDQIQFMKAGIMEIPDAFIINKCDAEAEARQSYYALRASLNLSRPGDEHRPEPTIHRTSAHTGRGLDKLNREIVDIVQHAEHRFRDKEEYFYRKWIRQTYGSSGIELLDTDPNVHLGDHTFDQAQQQFDGSFARAMCARVDSA